MKLLKDQRIDLEDGEVKLSIKPVTTSQQARLADLSVVPGISGRIELSRWALKNCIESLMVDGIPFVPGDLADSADLADNDTLAVFAKIGTMVMDASFVRETDAKK